MKDRSLDPELWSRIEPVLDRALDLEGSARETYLAEACADDTELRSQVERLLAADGVEEAFLDSSVDVHAAQLLAGDVDEGRTEVLDQPAGSRVGPYEIVRMIGAGGMGVVYEARDTRLERRVALKFLPPEYGRDATAKERFMREARAASTLEHPSICNIHDIGETDDGRLYIVMALYAGETIKDRLKKGPIAATEVGLIAKHLARGLRQAHEAGVVHRDIKPANVMLTKNGRPVILDFGVAKVGGDVDLTRAGSTLGTPAYMSPEQARGHKTDHRTDLWSLGVVLYEMLVGARPFEAGNAQAAIFSILNEEPKPLGDFESEIPQPLAAAVMKLLVKDPAQRLGSAGELLAALGAGDTEVLEAPPTPKRPTWIAIALAVALVVVLAVSWLGREPAPSDSMPVESDKKSLAVLFFDNVRGNPDLDWMRTGITDMLVTDLAQSREIEVLSTARVHQILDGLGLLETRQLGLDVVQAIAEAAGVSTLVRGSYFREGEVLQIAFQIDDLVTGKVLDSDRFQGRGDESLFQVVDELSAAIRNRFEVPVSATRPESIQAVTTESQEAWRFYTEALDLQRRARDREAVALLEQAVDIDPKFALALVNLGRFHRNIGHARESRQYFERALAESERLPVDQRLPIEASFLGSRWSTYGEAVEVCRQAIDQAPDKDFLRGILANRLSFLERFEEADAQFEYLIEHQFPFEPVHSYAAWTLAARGRFEQAEQILTERLRAVPDDWYNQAGLSFLLMQEGRFDDAEAALQEAIRLQPLDQFVNWCWWRLEVLREDWGRADAAIDRLAESTDAFQLWQARASEARNALYRGDSAAALASLEQASAAYDERDAQAAVSTAWAAELLLQLGRPTEALAEAEQAIAEGEGEFPELQGMFLAAVAHEALGDSAAADRLVEELGQRWQASPNTVEERQWLHLKGVLAMLRQQNEAALEHLTAAERLLPAHGIEKHDHIVPNHVPIWLALGRAELQAGRAAEASAWFRRIGDSTAEHVQHPVPFVRSFYLEAVAQDRLDRPAVAVEAFSRFLSFWRDGDLDREEVAEARVRTGS